VTAAEGRSPEAERLPPLPIRALGKAASALVTRAPVLWPAMRGATRRFWERSAASWEERIEPDRPEHLAPLAAACDRLDEEPGRVLELGTGTGSGALLLARRYPGAEIVGVDISEAMVRSAREKLAPELRERVRFAVADAGALPFEDGSFDLVAQLNLPAYFNESARVLGQGGHLIAASSLGPATPYYTPDRLLRRGFERRGLETIRTGAAGDGTYFIARRPDEHQGTRPSDRAS
jgi:SAM-dependent methyltransferase